MKHKILVFMPGYNVSRTIKKAITNLVELRKKLAFDILFVDNHSTDNTTKIVQNIINKKKIKYITIIKNITNLGYGGSQKVAFNYAILNNYDYLIEYDSDLQYPYHEILNLYKKIKSGKYCVVFGSRITKKNNLKQMPKWKAFGNKITNKINNWAFDFKVSEIHTGFRIYDINKIKKINLDKCHNDYRWTLDSVIEIMKINNNFGEIPVKALYHEHAQSPSILRLAQVMGYMMYRAVKIKIFGR